MILKKVDGWIEPVDGVALFKHVSEGNVVVPEKDYAKLESLLFAHGINYIKIVDEEDTVEQTYREEVKTIGGNF